MQNLPSHLASALFGLGHRADLVAVIEVDEADGLGGAARRLRWSRGSDRKQLLLVIVSA